jgi:hypothetical protein
MQRYFDLNTDKILSDWTAEHALRELFSNAIDETELSQTSKPLDLSLSEDRVLILRDYGRGLREQHFVQHEDGDKRGNGKMIGKFGMGLKDALSVLHQQGHSVRIKSQYLKMTKLQYRAKHNSDINTLHVVINPKQDPQFEGTIITVDDIEPAVYIAARNLFLHFGAPTLLFKCKYGEIYARRQKDEAHIYINGVRMGAEPNFLYDYNITNLTSTLSKAINRDRMMLKKTSYVGRIQDILILAMKEDADIRRSIHREYQKLARREGGVCHEISYAKIKKHEAEQFGEEDSPTLTQVVKREVSRSIKRPKEPLLVPNENYILLARAELSVKEREFYDKGLGYLTAIRGMIPEVAIVRQGEFVDAERIILQRSDFSNEKVFYSALCRGYCKFSLGPDLPPENFVTLYEEILGDMFKLVC